MNPATATPLISEDYRRMQQELHKNPQYGVASVEYAPLVADLVMANGVNELLDYGAGKGRLGQTLKTMLPRQISVRHYDPAIPEWSATPQPCECVACIDVLEHIEPDYLPNVLDDLKRLTRKYGVFTVHTGAAAKVLLDGRNAHLTQKPASWWLPLFAQRFEPLALNRTPGGFWIVVEALRDG